MPPSPLSLIFVPPLRVAHLVRPAMGGMRAQVRGLLAAFPQSLVAAPSDVCDFCADVVPDPNDRLPLASSNRPDKLLLTGARVGVWAKERGAHVLHGHGLQWLPLFAAAQAASGLPLVVTLHNLVPGDLSAAQNHFLRVTLSRAVRVIAVSRAVAESVRPLAAGTPEKIVVVRNGIDTRRFDPASLPPAAQIRALLNLTPDALVVTCVARLSPEKGLQTLLDAAALLRASFPRLRVFVAGDGPQKADLKNAANAANVGEIVTFLGARDDIPSLLRAADVYVQPSLSEGLGLAVLEAMASGLPVAASRVGGLPEVVAENETGLLVPPGDAPALSNALSALLTNAARRAAMGHAGRQRAISCFSVERMVTETRTVYEEAAASRRHQRPHP